MKFSILHPTARVTADFENPWWLAQYSAAQGLSTKEAGKDVEYILIVHQSRIAEFWRQADALDMATWGRFQVVVNTGRDCLVDQCNAGLAAVTADIIVGNQDDLRFPANWDTAITALIPDPSQMVCVAAANNTNRPDILTIPTIVTRRLAIAIGPLSPEYDGMFSDNEWSLQARAMGTVIPTQLCFEHRHPVLGLSKMDSVYAQENREAAYQIGARVFASRKAAGFPRVQLPGFPAAANPPASSNPAPQWRIIAVCCPGESHSVPWEKAFLALFSELVMQRFTLRFYFGYCTNVYHQRMGMTFEVLADCAHVGDPEYVLWIDDDNTPTAEAVRYLIETLDQQPEYGIACGWCWIRTRDEETGQPVWMPSCGNFEPGTHKLLSTKLDDLYADNAAAKRIEWSGFPTVLMRFSVLRELGPRAFYPLYTDDNSFHMMGEDTSFFVCADEAGIKSCVVPRAKVDHLKLMPIEPDYLIGPKADPKKAEAVEKDRERRNGPRLEASPQTRAFMGAAV